MVTFSLIQLLNLPAIIILGILTSIDDIKHSKIRNKYVLFSIIYSLVTLFVTILFIYIRGEKISIGYISLFFSNLLLALVFGFIVWISGLWSAGDAKLFLSFSALIPLTIYKWGTIGIFPSYIILINTFTPLFIYYFVKLFFKIKFKILISEIRMAINPKQLFNLLIFFLGFSWIIQIIIKFIGLDSNYIIRLAALIFIFFTLPYK